ncbi:hypothetical protein N7517_000469 [Penicillium concentricum]|uniref:Uncharacterized protein n=1 Tax=Penicillium concentricum TaxID=293559 RepID=A0A9W9SU52_9EURO|nr:uncharacterized protein N7517_000469 [Penicillium concentricum]KAJ5382558.1 hypothetical protein N7517_000469 [Penicillium concentricum]
MKFPKISRFKEQSEHFTPEAVERFPIEAAEAFEPQDEFIRRIYRTGSPPGTLVCSFPEPAPATSLNQFRFQLYRENGVWPGLTGYLDKYVNLTHLVWSMCAMLADSNIDPDWTNTFEIWRTEWRQFNKSFEIHGNTTRTLDVPPSPVDVIWIRKPNSLKYVQISLSEYKEKYDDHDILHALWKWMLHDVPAEAIVEGTYLIKLGYEPWFPKD